LIAPTEEDVAGNEEVSVDGNGEEAERVKHAADPGAPTAAQVEDHRKTHIPYRSWCKWCVLGRGRGIQHRKSAGASAVPIIGVDYFFLTKGGIFTRRELEFAVSAEGDAQLEVARTKGDVVKYLLVRCFLTKAVFAHMVPQKGLDENNVACDFVLGDLEWYGHTRIILKSDNGPAVKASSLVSSSWQRSKARTSSSWVRSSRLPMTLSQTATRKSECALYEGSSGL